MISKIKKAKTDHIKDTLLEFEITDNESSTDEAQLPSIKSRY